MVNKSRGQYAHETREYHVIRAMSVDSGLHGLIKGFTVGKCRMVNQTGWNTHSLCPGKRTGTRAVFTEQALQPDDARALARRTGIEVVSGHDGLLGDSLAPAGSPGDTYLTMMRHNATAIARNLR